MPWVPRPILATLVAATLAAPAGARAEDRARAELAAAVPTPWLDAPRPHRDAALVLEAEPLVISRPRRALAIVAAIVPGVVARGLGSYLVHEASSARRLALTGAIGTAAMIVGGIPVGVTGGHPLTIVPGVPLVVGGAGLVLSSWLSDVWVAAGGTRTAGAPRVPTPWSIEVGSTYVRDAFRRRLLGVGAARVVLGRVELGAGGLVHAGGAAVGGELEARVRILGAPWTGAVVDDGTRVTLRTAARARSDDDDQVDVATAEIEAIVRVDLRRLARALDGSFLEMSSGLGVERVTYAGGSADLSSLLLGRFAWGAYLGRRGEATLFYDHRRDQLAGGIAAGRAAGFVGSVGASVDVRVLGAWAARAELEIGSAWVSTLALRYQGGPR